MATNLEKLVKKLEKSSLSAENQLAKVINSLYKKISFRAVLNTYADLITRPTPQARLDGLGKLLGLLDDATAALIPPPTAVLDQLTDVYVLGIKAAAEMVEVGTTFGLINPAAVRVARGLISARLNKFWVGRDAVLSAPTRALITRALTTGAAPKELQKQLEIRLGVSKARASKIIRTELAVAQNTGMDTLITEAAEKAGVKLEKTWRATKDKRTRDSHRKLDGVTVDSDTPFKRGLMHPHDPSAPASEIVNCRCVAIYRRKR